MASARQIRESGIQTVSLSRQTWRVLPCGNLYQHTPGTDSEERGRIYQYKYPLTFKSCAICRRRGTVDKRTDKGVTPPIYIRTPINFELPLHTPIFGLSSQSGRDWMGLNMCLDQVSKRWFWPQSLFVFQTSQFSDRYLDFQSSLSIWSRFNGPDKSMCLDTDSKIWPQFFFFFEHPTFPSIATQISGFASESWADLMGRTTCLDKVSKQWFWPSIFFSCTPNSRSSSSRFLVFPLNLERIQWATGCVWTNFHLSGLDPKFPLFFEHLNVPSITTLILGLPSQSGAYSMGWTMCLDKFSKR